MKLNARLKNIFREEQVDLIGVLTATLDNLHNLVTYQTTEGKIVWANQRAQQEKYNSTLDELQGKYCYKVNFNNDSPCQGCAVRKVKETKQLEESEVTLPDGRKYLIRGYPIQDKAGELQGIVEISLDITAQKTLKKKFEHNKLKNNFFAGMSHEFKTPLNLIFSAVQLLEMKLERTELQSYIDIIQENSSRLLKLINNLLETNKMESSLYKLELENHEIVDLVKKITFSVMDYSSSKNIDLHFNSEVDRKNICCDAASIEKIMLNLLFNAVKFTEDGDEIFVNIYDGAEKITITVEDTGIGIPKEQQEVIFERFGQIENSMDTGNEGSGMGLFIVKFLVEMHDGEIRVESELGKGSKFIIELPAQKLSAAENSKCYINQEDIDLNWAEF